MDEGCTPPPSMSALRNRHAGSGPTRRVVHTERAGFSGGREALVKVVVDLTRCQGYAQCAFAAPDVFTIRGGRGVALRPRSRRRAAGEDRAGCGDVPGP